MSRKISLPTRAENFSEWYNQLVTQSWLAQNSDVRGCMVIKPYGFALRENIRDRLNQMFKVTGHSNAYFPLLIPKSYLSQEADHVEWFAKECAVVTHYRLKTAGDGQGVEVDPDAKLEEELIIRPTSETIIWRTYRDRIQSHRDLPILVNQRANVMRREMRTRMFLRTSEFLWQEGHTAHATRDEAVNEAYQMLDVYQDLMENFLAISGVPGHKSPAERFAGAEDTLTIEAMMQDGKALQSCTSHFLGQNFAKAFDVTYTTPENTKEHVRATSWGMSTRIIGGLIMSHSDDAWLILPPAVAPVHVVIVPIFKTDEELSTLHAALDEQLWEISMHITSERLGPLRIPLTIERDTDESKSLGWKMTDHERRGVPITIAVWARDLASGQVHVAIRDQAEKQTIAIAQLGKTISSELESMQTRLLEKSKHMREHNTVAVDTRDEFMTALNQGKFVLAHRDGTSATEEAIQETSKATIRCIPFNQVIEDGCCIYTEKPSQGRVIFARAY